MKILGVPGPDYRGADGHGWSKILAIKAIRSGCGLGLKDAKHLLDRACGGEEVELLETPGRGEALRAELERLGVKLSIEMTNEKVIEEIGEANPEALLADGFEDALIGHVSRFGMGPVALYDREKCIEILMADMRCEEDECAIDEPCQGACEHVYEMAQEHFDFNVIGAWVGDGTPAFATILRKLPLDTKGSLG